MATIKLRRGNAANLPALQAGEPAFALDTGNLYVGDGTKNVMISNGNDRYGVCATAAATVAKEVTIPALVNLVAGEWCFVSFTNANTAASPTLNVNSTGAKPIYYRNAAITAAQLTNTRMVELVYDGTQWELVGDIDSDTNTTYTTLTQEIVNTGTETTGKLITAKIIKDTVTAAVDTIDGGTF